MRRPIFGFRQHGGPAGRPFGGCRLPAGSALFGLALFVLLPAARGQFRSMDFGDAPAPYPTTLKDDGARHAPTQEFFLGRLVDWESDGQPEAQALGDDQNPAKSEDDEDGVAFPRSPLTPGATVKIGVQASLKGFLDAWIDFNQDGKWDPAAEAIASSLSLQAGANTVNVQVPADAARGETFARFRFSSRGDLQPAGSAGDGEVEDYQVFIGQGPSGELDFGDAPDSYQTKFASDGPSHTPSDGVWLGKLVDFESDGRPSSDAIGDDTDPAGAADDEDGVTFLSALSPGQTVQLQVVAGTSSLLDAWVDFGADGSFAEKGDRIFSGAALTGGPNTLTFTVPTSAQSGRTYARFRVSLNGGLDFFGPGAEGEVEDYVVDIVSTGEFGDAPAPYPTLLADNGARHRLNQDVFLGRLIDEEPDGQPDAAAQGDDLNPAGSLSDEDGVENGSDLYPGATVTLDVRASTSGILNAWVDFGGDGSWAEPGDQIFKDVPLSHGLKTLTFDVPGDARTGRTYARMRFNLKGGLSYDGPADDGEVEDYLVEIYTPPAPCERTNKGTDFWLTFPGNYAPDPDNPLRLSLCIVGPAETLVGVQIPGLDWQKAGVIDGSKHLLVELPPEADLGDANDEVGQNGIHVFATQEVAVFGLNRVRYTTDGYLGLPSDVVGQGYLIQAFGNTHEGVPSLNGTQFALVACQDDTTVSISPSVDTAGHAQGVPYQITLNQGETYQLRNTEDAPHDLSGTLLVADKPISVFAGHQCANLPNKDVWFCDYLVEQLLPVERSGHEFVTMPLATRTEDTFRFYGVVPGSQVFVNGAHVATLGLGEIHEMQIADPAVIAVEGAIFTVQYANSSDFDGVRIADPFELVIPPVDLWRSDYEICVPDSGFEKNYLNIVVRKGGQGVVKLDGVAIPAGDYVAIGSGAYFGVQVPVDRGVHFLTGDGTGVTDVRIPFGLSVYGWAEYDSYGYPGGMFFPDKTPPTVNCPQQEIVVQLQGGLTAACSAQVPDLTQSVTYRDNCPLSDNTIVIQNPPAGTSVGAGEHEVTVSVTDASGNTGSCTAKLIVLDSSTPVIDCPANRIVRCASGRGAVVEFKASAQTACGTPLPIVCDPPSGSTFPPGTTVVTCTAVNDAGEAATCSFTVTVTCFAIQLETATDRIVLTGIQGTLQTAPTVNGPWTDVPVNGDTYSAATTDRQQFFRLK